MKIAVLVPAYNEENQIRNTIKGIMDIPYNIDLFVIDDGSTDNTVKYVQEFKNVNLLRMEQIKEKGMR
ncbi:hypothetical protein SDC9_110681 [bioreactor metagenome]|uniref:Glycosyltransferase 2-like domain-containing protein n=1 Tax=bioreactor metagenome TaxID=1076179 RepID=A0A645BEN3_9ZZZZ